MVGCVDSRVKFVFCQLFNRIEVLAKNRFDFTQESQIPWRIVLDFEFVVGLLRKLDLARFDYNSKAVFTYVCAIFLWYIIQGTTYTVLIFYNIDFGLRYM